MKKLIFILFTLLAFTFACDEKKPDDTYKSGVRHKNERVTPMGSRVYSDTQISDQRLLEIDRGHSTALKIVKQYYPHANFRHADFTVYLKARSDKCENAGFLVLAPDYAGTEWDKGGGWICASGLTQNVYANQIVIVDDSSVAEEVTQYEDEHCFIAQLDPELHAQTWHHANGGHPILVDKEAQARGFVRKSSFSPGVGVYEDKKVGVLMVK